MGYNITNIDGDLAIGRNAEIGRDVDIHGKARVAGSLKVEGFLDAPNIKGAVKGLFATEEELNREYPNPRPGWCAIVLADDERGFLYLAKNREWTKQSEEAKPFKFIADSITVFASKKEFTKETQRAQEAENEIKKNAVKLDRIGITKYADKLKFMADTIEGDDVRYIDIPAATETKAGVMTAEDKKQLINLGNTSSKQQAQINNIRPVIYTDSTITNAPDEEDITATTENSLQFKNRDYGDGMGYVILRLNKTFAEQVIEENTIYEVRYDFGVPEIHHIPNNCVLRFNGGSISGFIECENTYIEGELNCLTNAIVTGTVVNSINLSWVGVYGNNEGNKSNFNKLEDSSIKSYRLDSNVLFKEGDVIVHDNLSISGCGNEMSFDCESAKQALIVLSQNCEIRNAKVHCINSNYAGVCILADTQVNKCHRFALDNVYISGVWMSEEDYKMTGLRINASNDNDNTNNYITGCRITNMRITWVKRGIEIVCHNHEKNSKGFAWLNEIYASNIFISALNEGVYTFFKDEAVTNKSDSVGPIYINNYEFQALGRIDGGAAEDAMMFSHDGNWILGISGGYCYDSRYKGEIKNKGYVVLDRVYGCFLPDAIGVEETIGSETTHYDLRDSVKIYNGYFNNNTSTTIETSYRQANYNPVNAVEKWTAGCGKGTAFSIKQGEGYVGKSILRKDNFNVVERIQTAGPRFFIQKCRNTGGVNNGGCHVAEFAPRYAIGSGYEVFSLQRVTNNLSGLKLLQNYGNSEVYKGNTVNLIWGASGCFYEGRIKLVFNIDKKSCNYATYKGKYDKIAINQLESPNLYSSEVNILYSYFKEEGDDLYIYFKGERIIEGTAFTPIFTIMYNRMYTEFEELEDGIPMISISNEHFLYSATVEGLRSYYTFGNSSGRPSEKNIPNIGFLFYDTALNKPIWWNGVKWIDGAGADVD